MNIGTESFVTLVKEFIAWVEAKPCTETAELKTAIGFVSRLYTNALALEDVNPESDVEAEDLSHEEWKAIYDRFASLPFNYYSIMFHPAKLSEEEPVIGDLADDLADIWRDLKPGLVLFEGGHVDEAVWHWHFHFNIHWGRHAAEALYAMHVFATDNDIDL